MKISNAFNSVKLPKMTKKGNAGYDNSRENIDDNIKTKAINAMEIVAKNIKLTNLRTYAIVYYDGTGLKDSGTSSNGDYITYARIQLEDWGEISSPVTGMLAFDYNTKTLMTYNGADWDMYEKMIPTPP